MADLRIKTGVSSVALGNSDQTMVDVRGTRDGAMYTAPWLTALTLEGRCFAMSTANATSPDTFNAVHALTEPDALITVPSGTTIIPVFIEVTFEDLGGTGVVDSFAVLSDVYDNVTTDTDVTIYNMRTDAPRKSLCQAVAVVTGAGTTPYGGNAIEFWRATGGYAEDAFNGLVAQGSTANIRSCWSIGKALVPPVIVGEGSLSVWASGAGGTGFITIVWAEVPSKSIV